MTPIPRSTVSMTATIAAATASGINDDLTIICSVLRAAIRDGEIDTDALEAAEQATTRIMLDTNALTVYALEHGGQRNAAPAWQLIQGARVGL